MSIKPVITGHPSPTYHIPQPKKPNLVRSDVLQFFDLPDAAESDMVCLCDPQVHHPFSIIVLCLPPIMLLKSLILTRFTADYSLYNQDMSQGLETLLQTGAQRAPFLYMSTLHFLYPPLTVILRADIEYLHAYCDLEISKFTGFSKYPYSLESICFTGFDLFCMFA